MGGSRALPSIGRSSSRRPTEWPGAQRTLTAQLSMAPAAMARLLTVSGAKDDFILSAVDGSTKLRVGLAVLSVPDSDLVIGRSGLRVDLTSSPKRSQSGRESLG